MEGVVGTVNTICFYTNGNGGGDHVQIRYHVMSPNLLVVISKKNKKKCPSSRLRIQLPREIRSPVPSRVSPLILHTQAGSTVCCGIGLPRYYSTVQYSTVQYVVCTSCHNIRVYWYVVCSKVQHRQCTEIRTFTNTYIRM